MKKNLLISALVGSALMFTAACSRNREDLPPEPPVAGETGTGSETDTGFGDNTGSVGQTALPGSAADFLQTVPSDRIYFDTDSHTVDDQGRATLDAQAEWLNRNPNVTVTVEGHADERGTREYNLALGDRRANAAKNYLAARGVSPSRMTTISWGKERPVAEGSDESAWAQNRRAVTVVPQ